VGVKLCTCDSACMDVTIQHQVSIKAVLSIEVDLAENSIIRKVFIKGRDSGDFQLIPPSINPVRALPAPPCSLIGNCFHKYQLKNRVVLGNF
jgi:hypothetical protein